METSTKTRPDYHVIDTLCPGAIHCHWDVRKQLNYYREWMVRGAAM